jgi:hypothetical protein
MVMDNNFWKWMECGQGAVGALAALATLYFTAGVYYGWNQPSPERKDYVLAGDFMTPPWWVIALGVLVHNGRFGGRGSGKSLPKRDGPCSPDNCSKARAAPPAPVKRRGERKTSSPSRLFP